LFVADMNDIEKEWTKQFEEWCDFFDEQKRLQKQWVYNTTIY